MDLLSFLTQGNNPMARAAAAGFAADWKVGRVMAGALLCRQGEPDRGEYLLLNGKATLTIGDTEGGLVCVGLFDSPCVITPNLARTRDGDAFATLEITEEALIAQMDTEALTERMLSSEEIRNWANAVLRQEIQRKADREWALASLGGAGRLAWFRTNYPEYENSFAHGLIASFLGMTPVSLSRLRKETRSGGD
jgi:CRP-like cAMP-binding protein